MYEDQQNFRIPSKTKDECKTFAECAGVCVSRRLAAFVQPALQCFGIYPRVQETGERLV